MQFFYENQNSNSFLVYKLEDSDKLDSFNYGMLANNKINNIIPANLTQLNAEKYLRYNVSSTVTLKQYFEGIVNKKRIVNVFLSICSALIDASEYMIDTSMIILDPEYIFVDVSTAKASLICFPIVGYSSGIKEVDFFKNIIFTIQYDRTENSDYVAEIITFLNSNENFSIENFKNMVSKLVFPSSGANPVAKIPEPVKPIVSKQPEIQSQPVPTPVISSPIIEDESINSKSVSVPASNKQSEVSKKPVVSGSFAIPTQEETIAPVGKKANKEKTKNERNKSDKEEKMSLLHLLSNFSKENLEIYKAQKEQTAVNNSDSIDLSNDKKTKKKKGLEGNPVAGFAIPGQPVATSTPDPTPTPIPTPTVQSSNPIPNNGVVNNSSPIQNRPVVSESNGNFGQTVNLSALSQGTTVLGSSPQATSGVPITNPRLIRSKNNETVIINKPVFRIGKENSYVDYFISDNSAISRSHANIICRDDSYFIVDTNSTNRTYVNGVMIQSNIEIQINDKDIVRLADEDFEFRIF